MTQRESHGIQFTACPECQATIGQRGLARHMEQIHGVAPATRKKAPKLSPAEKAILVELAATGDLSEARRGYKLAIKKLTRLALITESLEITEAGRALA